MAAPAQQSRSLPNTAESDESDDEGHCVREPGDVGGEAGVSGDQGCTAPNSSPPRAARGTERKPGQNGTGDRGQRGSRGKCWD